MRTSVNYLKSVSEKHVYHKISGENEKQGHEINISIANENTAFIFGNHYDKEDNDINNGDDDGTKYEIQKIVLIIIIALGLPRSTKSTVSKNSFLIFTAIIPNIFP